MDARFERVSLRRRMFSTVLVSDCKEDLMALKKMMG